MARLKPASGTLVTYLVRIASSAGLLAVNSPVKKLLSFLTLAIRASAAFIQVSLSVTVLAHAHAAVGFFDPFGMAQALPPTMLTGLPSWSVKGVLSSCRPLPMKSRSTLMYQFSMGKAATAPAERGFFSPKMSKESRNDLNAVHPPWSLTRPTAKASASTALGSFRFGAPSSLMIVAPFAVAQSGKYSGSLGSKPIRPSLLPFFLKSLAVVAFRAFQSLVWMSLVETPASLRDLVSIRLVVTT